MPRAALFTAFVSLAVGIGCAPEPPGTSGKVVASDASACQVQATTPAFEDTDVFVGAPLHVTWTAPVDAASLPGQIQLARLGGDPVPINVVVEPDGTATVSATQSLRFWDAYALTIGDGVLTSNGSACTGEEVAFTTRAPSPLPRDLRPAAIEGIAVIGHYALVASSSYRGLQVYDVSLASMTHLIAEVPTDESPVSLTVFGNRAYAPAGFGGVLIFDVGNAWEPQLIGRASTPGRAIDVAPFAANGRFYIAVADYENGVRMIDVSDPAGPKDLGAFFASGTPEAHTWGVDVQGQLLAVADGVLGLATVDISDPEHPLVLARVTDDYDLYDVALDGPRAYTSRGPRGIRSWDLTNPTSPLPGSVQEGPTNVELDRIQRVVVDGSEIFAATGSVGVERISVADDGTMTMAAVHDVPGRAWSVAVSDEHIFAGGEAGLAIYQRGAPSGTPPVWFDPNGHGLAREVAMSNGHAYVAAGSRGLQTFATDPSGSLTLVDQDDTPATSLDVAAGTIITDGDLILLGDMRAGVVLFDGSSPEDPVPVGFIDSIDTVQGMQVVGNTLYACESNAGMFVADIAEPAAPTLLAREPFPPDLIGCSDILVLGDRALLGTQAGLAIVDVSDASAPSWLGWAHLHEEGSIQYLRQVGSYMLATLRIPDFEGIDGFTRRLLVFDVTDPSDPELVWQSNDLGGGLGEIAVHGDIAFVAGGDQGVFVFHLVDITAPELEGVIATSGNVSGVALQDDVLYVAQANGGLITVPLGMLPP